MLIYLHGNLNGEPNSKVTDQYHSVKGNVTETTPWTQSDEGNILSKAEYKATQATEFIHRTMDCIGGRKPFVVGAVIGGRSQETGGM
ncbi:hypothetical protein VTO73DRAFT_10796 [Trametes versicolor]